MADPTGLTIQTATSAGAELTLTSADTVNGNRWLNSGNEILVIYNAGASSATVTATTALQMDSDLDIEDRVWTVGAGEYHFATLPRTDIYNDASGYAVVTAGGDGAADIDFAVVKK